MMGKNDFDVIVIGAGLGGSSCAALLAKRGLQVLLLDKNAAAGGKASSVTKRGFNYCVWQVSGCPATNNRYEAVLREIGKEDQIRFYPPKEAFIVRRKSNGESSAITLDMSRGLNTDELFSWLEAEGKDKEASIRVLTDIATMSPKDIEALDDTSFAEFLNRYPIPRQVYSFLIACLAEPMLLVPAAVMSASEAVLILKGCLNHGFAIEYEGGMGKLAQLYADSVLENAGVVMMGTRAEKLIIDDGRVTGVATDKGLFKAPIVISNAGIQPTVLKLAGEAHFDKSYVNYVKDLVVSVAWMGARYFLSQSVTTANFIMNFADDDLLQPDHLFKAQKPDGSPNVATMYSLSPSNYDPTCAPDGKQLLLMGYACPKDPNDMTAEDIKRYHALQEAKLFAILPDIPTYLEHREIFTTRHVSNLSRDYDIAGQGGECIGLAQIVQQCGRYKPSPKAPVRGLFFVGTDAGGRTIGTNQAVDSGINVARMVQHYHLMHASD